MPSLRLSSVLVGLGLLLVAGSPAQAGNVDLQWDPVAGASGYRVYFGTDPGVYTGSLDVGSATQAVVRNLAECEDWHFAVKAYNYWGESEAFSNEVGGWPSPSFEGFRVDSGSTVSRVVTMQGDRVLIEIDGANFAEGLDLRVNNRRVQTDLNEDGRVDENDRLIRVESVSVPSCNRIQALVSVDPAGPGGLPAQIGDWDVLVVNPADSSGSRVYGTAAAAFEVHVDPGRFDINRSDVATTGRLDGKDTVWMSRLFGSREGGSMFDPDSDLNGDGWVDGEDLAYLAGNLGSCWGSDSWSVGACPAGLR